MTRSTGSNTTAKYNHMMKLSLNLAYVTLSRASISIDLRHPLRSSQIILPRSKRGRIELHQIDHQSARYMSYQTESAKSLQLCLDEEFLSCKMWPITLEPYQW